MKELERLLVKVRAIIIKIFCNNLYKFSLKEFSIDTPFANKPHLYIRSTKKNLQVRQLSSRMNYLTM